MLCSQSCQTVGNGLDGRHACQPLGSSQRTYIRFSKRLKRQWRPSRTSIYRRSQRTRRSSVDSRKRPKTGIIMRVRSSKCRRFKRKPLPTGLNKKVGRRTEMWRTTLLKDSGRRNRPRLGRELTTQAKWEAQPEIFRVSTRPVLPMCQISVIRSFQSWIQEEQCILTSSKSWARPLTTVLITQSSLRRTRHIEQAWQALMTSFSKS